MVDAPLRPTARALLRKAPRVDGRRLRSERTRRLIVEAYMALVRENAQMPTAVQIAERAGYSVRSIFERFPDLDRVARRRHRLRDRGGAVRKAALRDLDADRATRIRSQVEPARPRLRAMAAAVARAVGRLCAIARPAQRITLIRQLIVMRMEMMFKPELSAMADSDAQEDLLALEAITDFRELGAHARALRPVVRRG